MTKLRVHCISLSLDGFAAGPQQDLANPLGIGGPALFDWFFPTDTFMRMHDQGTGTTGIDNDFAMRGFNNIGAWILGRNMFGPVRGEWPDESWQGWWGEEPPYRVPVFVLTHYPRPHLEMRGGTTFYFVTEGIQVALDQARAAADGRDVRIGGGAATLRQYLQQGLIDEMHLAYVPVLLGRGEELLHGIDLVKLNYRCTDRIATDAATHIVLTRQR